MITDHIQECLMAQHGDQETVDEIRKEIQADYEAILSDGGSFSDLEDLMLDNGIDLDGIEDLLFG